MSADATERTLVEDPALEMLTQHLGWRFVPADELEADRESPTIAVLTRRLAAKLREFNPWLFEVYPAASLAAWGITDIGSYKSTSAAKREAAHVLRRKFLGCIRERFSLTGGDELSATDHALDALVAALTAHAAKIGGTFPPEATLLDTARREGWIHVPRP